MQTTAYKVYASNYNDKVFGHWENGGTNRVRSLATDKATTITAYYDRGTNVNVEFKYSVLDIWWKNKR